MKNLLSTLKTTKYYFSLYIATVLLTLVPLVLSKGDLIFMTIATVGIALFTLMLINKLLKIKLAIISEVKDLLDKVTTAKDFIDSCGMGMSEYAFNKFMTSPNTHSPLTSFCRTTSNHITSATFINLMDEARTTIRVLLETSDALCESKSLIFTKRRVQPFNEAYDAHLAKVKALHVELCVINELMYKQAKFLVDDALHELAVHTENDIYMSNVVLETL